MSLRDKAEAALENPHVQLFLDLLAEAEGASKGYNTLFGGATITNLSQHPNKRQEYFNSKAGKTSYTTAAGRYQFKHDSWQDQAKRLGLTDFSPRSQDLAAIGLMMYKPKTMAALMNGDYETALRDYGTYWASLPSSPHNQPNRSAQWVKDKLSSLAGAQLRDKHYALSEQLTAKAPPLLDKNFTPYKPPPPVASLGEFVDRSIQGAQEQWAPADSAAQGPLGMELLTDPLIGAGIDADANRARNQAVADFTGEAPRHDLELPDIFDQAISKLLVKL